MDDRRTTPPLLQIPGVVLLIATSIYFLAGFHHAMRDDGSSLLGYGTWEMFTVTGHTSIVLRAEGLRKGAWSEFDLEALFPYRWETGPRYARFYRNPAWMRVLARAACGRSPEPPEAIRLYGDQWTLRPYREPNVSRKRVDYLEHRCSR